MKKIYTDYKQYASEIAKVTSYIIFKVYALILDCYLHIALINFQTFEVIIINLIYYQNDHSTISKIWPQIKYFTYKYGLIYN